MLRIENLQVKYKDFIAVSSVSMEAAAGQITALIGANGAGKTSLLSSAAGLISPAEGRVFFCGEDITALSADQIVSRGLSLVPQGGHCFLRMSVRDNLMVGSYPKAARPHAKASLERVLTLFPMLKEKLRDPAGSLSGGQRQMLAIGRAMMSEPKCMLFDEISLGLAPIAIRDLYERVLRLNREEGVTMVIVEQDTDRALRTSDTCYVMLKGRVMASGASSSLSPDMVRAAYFGMDTE